MQKLGILFTSRYNYEIFDLWFASTTNEGFEVLSIDEDSTPENKQKGKDICKKHGITYMDREKRGMFNNIETAKNYFKSKGIEWVIWFQHDCFPLTEDFFTKLNNLILSDKLDGFGAISFNICHGYEDITAYMGGDRDLKFTARAPLEIGDHYYRHKHRRMPNGALQPAWTNSRVDYTTGKFDKPFAIESVGFGVLLSFDMWEKHIEVTDDFVFYMSTDDIAFQFLYHNVYNLCIPYLTLGHAFQSKGNFGIPISSPKGTDQERDHFFGEESDQQAISNLIERWGWDYRDRNTFEPIKEHYKGTLFWEFYHHDPINGPLRSFDI